MVVLEKLSLVCESQDANRFYVDKQRNWSTGNYLQISKSHEQCLCS